MVGLDAFALSGPGWLLTLWGGLLADRFNRKHVVLFFQFIQMIAVAIIIILMYSGWLAPWMLIVASLVSGITDSLSMPALQTLVPSLVSKEEMPRAVSLNSLQFNISRMIGPAIAGFAMAKYGAIACFSGNLLSYVPLFFAVVLVYPKKSHPLLRLEREWQPKLSDFTSVLKHKIHFKLLLSVLINGLLVMPTMVFVPVLMKQVLHGSAEHLGVIMGAAGIGGLIGALSGAPLSKVFKRPSDLILFPLGSGILLAILAFSQNLVILGLGMMLLAAGTGILAVTTNSRIQVDSEDRHRGRASSFFQLSMQGGIALGGLWTGVLSQFVGIQQALLINGSACALLQFSLFFIK